MSSAVSAPPPRVRAKRVHPDAVLSDPAGLLRRLRGLRASVDATARKTLQRWQPLIIRRSFLPSAENLAHYLALRQRDLRSLQADLVPWGLSSLGRSEARARGLRPKWRHS